MIGETSSITDKVLLSIKNIKEIYGYERFTNGDCANLILALGQCLVDMNKMFGVTIIDSFTSEDEDAEESGIYKEMGIPECFSHCYINIDDQDIDINGLNAFENWTNWLDLPSEQNKWGEYELLSEIPIEGDTPKSLLNSLAIIAEQSGVPLNYGFVNELSDIIKKDLCLSQSNH